MNTKTHTKKQIAEAIAYWQKQLELGNYKKTDEAVHDSPEDDYEEQRAGCKNAKKLHEKTVDALDAIGKPMKRISSDSYGNVTVKDLLDIKDALYDGQENTVVNVGPEGEIFGQVNQVLTDSSKCILTLAPYHNGRRSKNLSAGCEDAPLKMLQFAQLLKEIPVDAEVVVRMKDPYGFGPSVGKIIEVPVKSADIDSAYGVFLRIG